MLEVSLCDICAVSPNIYFNGIICYWRNRRDYFYWEFLKDKGILDDEDMN